MLARAPCVGGPLGSSGHIVGRNAAAAVCRARQQHQHPQQRVAQQRRRHTPCSQQQQQQQQQQQPEPQPEPQHQRQHTLAGQLARLPAATAAASLALVAMSATPPGAAAAAAAGLALHAEPANALSLPTWAIHVSSVTEWVAAMALMWRYGEVSGTPAWKGMAWGMMPSLGSAMAACTWHFFYNSPDLDFLVALQAFLTVVGNFTCWIAAYRIYLAVQAQQASS